MPNFLWFNWRVYFSITPSSSILWMRAAIRGIENVFITEMQTHLCCDTTTREASARGYQTMVIKEGVRTFDIKGVDGEMIPRETIQYITLIWKMYLYGGISATGNWIDIIATAFGSQFRTGILPLQTYLIVTTWDTVRRQIVANLNVKILLTFLLKLLQINTNNVCYYY